MALALEIFKNDGLNFLTRWAHVLSGITWIGLLYYFNFVQVPAFAELDAGARNQAVDKLASRALWWFRWAALATFGFGVLLGLIPDGPGGKGIFSQTGFFKGSEGVAIATGMLFGITMFLNVWGVIWRNQKVVIDWTAVGDTKTAQEFSSQVIEAQRSFADRTSIIFVYQVTAFLPAIGLLTIFLPNIEREKKAVVEAATA